MRILLIAPECYPVDGAESIVNIKLLQTFSQFENVTIDLVSRKHSVVTYPSADISKYGVCVNSLHIVESCNRLNIKTAWQTLMCFLVFGCAYKGSVWAYAALQVVKDLIKNNHYDFVLTKSSPSFLLGAYCHKRGLKWVASWNDPFPVSFYPAPYGEGNCHRPSLLEKLMLRNMKIADFHVFPSEKLKNHMHVYLKFNNNKAKVIPHAIVRQGSHKYKNDGVLHIIHSGNMHGARNPHSFFNALNNYLQESPEVKIQFTVMGDVAEEYKPHKEQYPFLYRCFNYIPPVEYTKALQSLKDYAIACIIEAPCKKGEAIFLPTKVTDFMQEGIPIMAISPQEGVLHEMYKKGNIGYFADVNDENSIKQTLNNLWMDFKTQGLKNNKIDYSFTPPSIFNSYSEIAKALAKS